MADKDVYKRQDVKLFGSSLDEVDFKSISSAKALAYITAYVENRAYQDAGIGPRQRQEMDGYGLPIGVQEKRGYKARPLDGIWATPPFLHNGSVANLFELLSPVYERQARFWVGNFEYEDVYKRQGRCSTRRARWTRLPVRSVTFPAKRNATASSRRSRWNWWQPPSTR